MFFLIDARWAGMQQAWQRNVCWISVAEPEEEWELGRPKRRWEIILKCISEKEG
jgi:hypothetical protein